jgi:hypothetical protein
MQCTQVTQQCCMSYGLLSEYISCVIVGSIANTAMHARCQQMHFCLQWSLACTCARYCVLFGNQSKLLRWYRALHSTVKRFLTLSLTLWYTPLLLHTRVTLWSGRTGEAVSTYTAEQLCGYAAADITAFCLKQSGHKVCRDSLTSTC